MFAIGDRILAYRKKRRKVGGASSAVMPDRGRVASFPPQLPSSHLPPPSYGGGGPQGRRGKAPVEVPKKFRSEIFGGRLCGLSPTPPPRGPPPPNRGGGVFSILCRPRN